MPPCARRVLVLGLSQLLGLGCTSVLGIGEPSGAAGGDASLVDATDAPDAPPMPDGGVVAIASVPSRTGVIRGAQATLAVTLAGPVPAGGATLTLLQLPAGVSSTPVTLAAGDTGGMLTVDADAASAVLGLAMVRVQAKVVIGGLMDEAPCELLVGDPAGTPDVTFGGDGISTLPVSGNGDDAVSVIVQADGKAVVGLTVGGNWTFVRFAENGTVDPSFGTAGVVTSKAGTLRDMVLLSNGKYVAVGTIGTLPGILRFNADGTPDDSFGSSGQVAFPMGAVDGNAFRVDADASGDLWVAGDRQNGNPPTVSHLYHASANGILDINLPVENPDCARFSGVAVQPSTGRILTVCTTGSPAVATLQRWSTSGTLDSTFGANGTALLGSGPASITDLAVFADGKLVVVGSTFAGNGEWMMLRGEADGAPGPGMSVRTGIVPLSPNGVGTAVALEPGGRILITAFGFGSFSQTAALYRFGGDGSDDASFGTAGLVQFGAGDFTPKHRLDALAIDPLGRYVAVGNRNDSGLLITRVWP